MLKFLFLGIIQGVTEFLPVSSSGHLYLFNSFFPFQSNPLAFIVLLHFATLLAVIFFFFPDIKQCLKNKKTISNIIIITLLTAVVAVVIKQFLISVFSGKYFLAASFSSTAVILLCTKSYNGRKTISMLSLNDILLIGLLQGISALPGISRSGITIAILLKLGFDAKESFKFSFLASIPIIFAAFILEGPTLLTIHNISFLNILFGFIAAFFSGLFALKLLKGSIDKQIFYKFGYYCFFVSIVTLLT